METKAVKLTQVLRACSCLSGMLFKGIYTHLPGRCLSGNVLCFKTSLFKTQLFLSVDCAEARVRLDGAAGITVMLCPLSASTPWPIRPEDGFLHPFLLQAPVLPCAFLEPINPTRSAGKHSVVASPAKSDFRAWKTGGAKVWMSDPFHTIIVSQSDPEISPWGASQSWSMFIQLG